MKTARVTSILCFLLLGVVSCNDSAGPTKYWRVVLQPASDTVLTGVVGSLVTSAPRVRATTPAGDPVAGVRLTVRTVGGGSVGEAVVFTGADGLATADGWTLGTVPGHQALQVNFGPKGVTFSIEVTPGPPASTQHLAGDGQAGFDGDTLPMRLRVRVADAFGNLLAGEQVTFSVAEGGGHIDGEPVATDAQGVAVAGPWTLGAAGMQRVTASVAGRHVAFTAQSYACDASCDALEFAFVRGGHVYRRSLRAGNVIPVVAAFSGYDFAPAWTSDGKQLAFTHYRPDPAPPGATGNWNAEVWIADVTAGSARYVMPGLDPAWSPDGRQLVLSRGDCWYSCSSFIVDVNDTTARVSLPVDSYAASWSPDGSRLAFVRLSGDDGFHALQVIDAAGGGLREILPPGGFLMKPSWSPGGDRILYVENGDVFVVPADGLGLPQRLTAEGTWAQASWSPDGQWILLSGWGPNVVAFIPATGGWPIQLLADASAAVWRPLRNP